MQTRFMMRMKREVTAPIYYFSDFIAHSFALKTNEGGVAGDLRTPATPPYDGST